MYIVNDLSLVCLGIWFKKNTAFAFRNSIFIYSIRFAKPGGSVEDFQGFMHDGFHDVWILFGISLFLCLHFGFHFMHLAAIYVCLVPKWVSNR